MKGTFFAFLFLFISTPILAEYRAYMYLIKNHSTQQMIDFEPYYMTSSLNPMAMKAYYGSGSQLIELVNTWLCPGDTAKKVICSPPEEKIYDAVFNSNEGA